MKYLISFLFVLASMLTASAQDVPARNSLASETNRPAANLLRLVYLKPQKKLVLMDDKGQQIELDATRKAKLFQGSWPPEQITSPVFGDVAEGPALASDASILQYATFDGTKWIYDVKRTGSPFP